MPVDTDKETNKTTFRAIGDFAKTFAILVTSLTVIGSALLWFTLPRITEWVAGTATSAVDQYVMQAQTNAATLEDITVQLLGLVNRIDELQRSTHLISEPVLTFEDWGNEITDAPVGGRVTITWRFRKLHECGAPSVNVFFRNGDDLTHRFEEVSIINELGEGIGIPADPYVIQTLSYSATIPEGEGVQAGRAHAWVTLRYNLCPRAPPSISPEVPFRILSPSQ